MSVNTPHQQVNIMSGSAAIVMSVIANAIKASGVLVQVDSKDFLRIVQQSEKPLIVHASSKVIRTTHKYLTSYKGLAFYTKVNEPLLLGNNVELIESRKISIPDM